MSFIKYLYCWRAILGNSAIILEHTVRLVTDFPVEQNAILDSVAETSECTVLPLQ